MTERGASCLHRSESELCIGPSALQWGPAGLTIDVDERTLPFASRVRGQVRVHPEALSGMSYRLDAAGRHRWLPIAPRARVEVVMQKPALRWSGIGYLDANAGDIPLEDSFTHWGWSRASLGNHTAILYELEERSGNKASLALDVDGVGGVMDFTPPPPVRLPRTKWRVTRTTRAEDGQAQVQQTLEDTPFYARSVVNSRLFGKPVTALHESLSLDRFRAPVVQAMLPFRMPRAFH